MSVADARRRDAEMREHVGPAMTVAERDRHNLLEHIDDLERELVLLRKHAARRPRLVIRR